MDEVCRLVEWLLVAAFFVVLALQWAMVAAIFWKALAVFAAVWIAARVVRRFIARPRSRPSSSRTS